MMQGETFELEVAILGGGFAGVYCAKELVKHVGDAGIPNERKVGVIADENHMTFQPMLAEVAGGSLAPRHVVNPIRLLAKGSRVYKAKIKTIDFPNKQLIASAGAFTPDVTFKFKHLVLALGSVVDMSRIPGMPEHAQVVQNVGDAMKLRATIISRMEEANLVRDAHVEKRRSLLNFVVVGGGYSGVEIAGQLIDLLNAVHKFYRNVNADDFSVTLIHSRDALLPTMSAEMGAYTKKVLEEQGVHVILNSRVKCVTATQVDLGGGHVIPAATVISTVGNAPHPLMLQLMADTGAESARGRIVTDEYLRVPGQDGLWAIGDCAAVPFKGHDGESCPPTAQFAMRQGVCAGKNIGVTLKGGGLKAFTFQGLGELASIGHYKAVANIMGLNFSGFIAWWMWRTIYLSKLPGLDRKLRVLSEWTLDVFFPKDISLLTPSYTSTLKETYLEAGDMLFEAGDPAFSFYVVKSGSIDIVDGATRRLIRRIPEGGHFGERALMEDRIWRYTAIAKEPSTLVALGASVFNQLIASCGDIANLLRQTAATYASQQEIDTVVERLPETARGRTAQDFMVTEVTVLRTNHTVGHAMAELREHPHSTYPVTDEEGHIAGVLKRSQVYRLLRQDAAHATTTLADVPLSALPIVGPTLSAADLMEKLIRHSATKALISSDGKTLDGIVALVDLLSAGEGKEADN